MSKISLVSEDKTLGSSSLTFKISGDDINYIIMNTIRRTIFSEIPIYAFAEFKFEKNTSIFHNNYLKARMSNPPVWGIDNDIDFIKVEHIEEKAQSKEEAEPDSNDEIVMDTNEKAFIPSSLKQLTMYVNYKNKTSSIVDVTTDHANFYYDEKKIDSPYKHPFQIVKLQPEQEIVMTGMTKLGNEQQNVFYSAVSCVYYKQIDDNTFDFSVESRGQISERRILHVALLHIDKRLKHFYELFEKDFVPNEDDPSTGTIIMNDEDNTMGNLISRGLQLHKDISYADYKLEHPLVRKVFWDYKLKSTKTPIKKIVKEVVDNYIDLFEDIKKKLSKI